MASQKLFVMFVVGLVVAVVGRPQSLDVFNARDDLNPKESDVVKRKADLGAESNDIAELNGQKISLASFIDNIESGLLQTALSVGNVASNPDAQIPVVTSRPITKRSTVEDKDSAQPEVLVQTTEKVGAVDAIPAHVVIDRVSVFKAPTTGVGLFPTFHLQETVVSGETGEVISNVEENQYVLDGYTTLKFDLAASSESVESDESSSSSSSEEVNEVPSTSQSLSSTTAGEVSVSTTTPSATSSTASPTTPSATSSTASPTTPSATSSTTKTTLISTSTTQLPVDEKKSVEKELKEKVAEVEADPVILTARV